MMQCVESGVPCTTLFVIQALPLRSKTRLPGPPNGQSSLPLVVRPAALTLTARVKASSRVHLLFALGPNFAVRYGVKTWALLLSAKSCLTLRAGLRAICCAADHVVPFAPAFVVESRSAQAASSRVHGTSRLARVPSERQAFVSLPFGGEVITFEARPVLVETRFAPMPMAAVSWSDVPLILVPFASCAVA